ncbi:MAG: HD domain-containing protein [Thermoplasmata archaeon]|nr:HD domain-containing protein [Thermoplasmata archaeon]
MASVRRGPRKTIFDPVHGVISLEGASLDLVGHRSFQRLWGIRQTGLAHLVFPGANHTRLEHSLGVYAVVRTMADRLGLDAESADRVAAGGLLHDLGHTPLSHTLEPTLREVTGAGHESRSRAMIVEGTNLPPSGEAGPTIPELLERHRIVPRSVGELVDPAGRSPPPLLRAILHGAIDADRIDYLQRDAYYTGVAHGTIDAARLLDTVRATRSRLVFAEKGRQAVEGFLVGRALMYSSVYYHKTVRAAEVMAQAAVERVPGYPETARSLLDGTDGDLLVALQVAGGRSAALAQGLRERRLHKRVVGWKKLAPSERAGLRKLVRQPTVRREREDALADRIGAPPGAVLFDLAGLDAREPRGADWAEVGVAEDGRVVHPFRPPSVWRSLAIRPPSVWSASLYVEPRFRAVAERRFGRRAAALL